MAKKGKFIVIEGTDGSGKATQIKLLAKKLKKLGIKFKSVDFPQYDKPSAYFVEKYLRGEYGTADVVGPERASVFYALDRYDKSFEIKKWLNDGYLVICNRYVSANMGHQAGKIKDRKKRDAYLAWLDDFEYGMFGIPRPDAVIFLHLPAEAGQKFVGLKGKRAYTRGKKMDLHEADLRHLKNAEDAYIYVAKKYGWEIIEEIDSDGQVLPIPEVGKLVFSIVMKIIKGKKVSR